ncbi:uncharacterized protein FOKN1_2644 [Thiohalobacter thiocyanaticus]|uniref:Uncharacterized protein n=1 Tax=Thiohalobacter thiocyanaticus TaxID=585455 RepID=A0A1Z4VUZ4_9GAMM|nr:uncharacterized protein FOKN1_2644 [Thiohalobacter thiocyanaticus]
MAQQPQQNSCDQMQEQVVILECSRIQSMKQAGEGKASCGDWAAKGAGVVTEGGVYPGLAGGFFDYRLIDIGSVIENESAINSDPVYRDA